MSLPAASSIDAAGKVPPAASRDARTSPPREPLPRDLTGLSRDARDTLISSAAPARTVRRPYVRAALFDLVPRLAALVVLAFAIRAGFRLRDYTFSFTAPVRFVGDINNGLHQGARVLHTGGAKPKAGERVPLRQVFDGWVKVYDDLYARERQGAYSLDYTPLRLMVMTLWSREVWFWKGATPNYSDDLAGPLMKLNAYCGLAAAAGTFLLARKWRRAGDGPAPRLRDAYATWRGSFSGAVARHGPWVAGLFAGLLVWFNPAVLVGAHGFPQWDVWLVPFFVFAFYAASCDAWLTAGALVAVGSMFKGQGLLVAPVLAAWPLLQGRPVAALRFAVGVASGIAMTTWPWLVRSAQAVHWMEIASGAVAGFSLVGWLLPRKRRWKWVRIAPLLLATAGLAIAFGYPAKGETAWPFPAAVGGAALIAAISLWARPIRALPHALIGVWGVGCLLSAWHFGGSWSWYEIGFKFPTDHYQNPANGPAINFNTILMHYYHWGLKDLMFRQWTLQECMRGIYFATLIPVSAMLAWHARRKSPRALLCMSVPWVLMFCFVPQMHERYLLWGAACTAAAAAVGPGGLLLHLCTTFVAFSCIAIQMLNTNGGWWPLAHRVMGPMFPSMGWVTLFLAMTFLYACMIPPRRPIAR